MNKSWKAWPILFFWECYFFGSFLIPTWVGCRYSAAPHLVHSLLEELQGLHLMVSLIGSHIFTQFFVDSHRAAAVSILFWWFVDEGFMDVWDDPASRNCALDQSVQLFISSNCKLQMAGCDALHLQIFAGISCKFQNLSCEVFKNGSWIHCSRCTHSSICCHSWLQ